MQLAIATCRPYALMCLTRYMHLTCQHATPSQYIVNHYLLCRWYRLRTLYIHTEIKLYRTYRMVIAQPQEIIYVSRRGSVHIWHITYPPNEKWRRFKNIWPSRTKRFICCALTIQYIMYSTVGRSIDHSIYNT